MGGAESGWSDESESISLVLWDILFYFYPLDISDVISSLKENIIPAAVTREPTQSKVKVRFGL